MRDEEDVAVVAEEASQLGLPARLRLAAVVIEDGAERTASGGREDEAVQLEPAAGEGNFFRLAGPGGRRYEE
jgi:hypothetical protein